MGFPLDISTTGHHLDSLMAMAIVLIGIAFAAVVAILLYSVIRFRARPGRRALYLDGTSRRAFGLTVALSLLVFFGIDVNLAYNDHHVYQAMWGAPAEPDALVVQVLAERFAWNFRYAGPDGRFGTADDLTPATLVVPEGRQVLLKLRARDVLHSFFLPNLRIKQDVLPGLQTSMYFTCTRSGTYEIACAELCGNMHSNMRGMLKVVTPEEFEAWRRRYGKTFKPNTAKWKDWEKGVRRLER